MKTKEFIKKVEAMGFKIEGEYGGIAIFDNCFKVAVVDTKNLFAINTIYCKFDELEENKKQKFIKLLIEYASTPIDEREEEKKYMYRLKHVGGIEYIEDYRYLNYDTEYNSWTICDKTNAKVGTDTGEVFEVKYIFTHSELKSLGVDIEQLQEFYEEIEVEE